MGKNYVMMVTGAILFMLGMLVGIIWLPPKVAPAVEDLSWEDAGPRYTTHMSQTIEYGLIYTKTDMVTGETRMYIVKNGKLEPFLSDHSQ